MMDIIKIIQETATWIEKVNNDFETNLFRTESFAPKKFFYDMGKVECLNAFGEIISKRSALLNESNIELIPVNELPDYGRIMYFESSQAIPDGAAQEESEYYIDDSDAPPSDTWITLGSELNSINFFKHGYSLPEDMLIAWVPKKQYFFVQGALEVSALDIFKWPGNSYISDEFFSIKDVFSAPENFIKPKEAINLAKRIAFQKRISDLLDKKSFQPTLIGESKQSNRFKFFWTKLFGKNR